MSAYYPKRINRGTSPFRANFIPVISVMLGSMTPLLPLVASAPILPPFGLLILLAWRLIRPNLLPVWVGFPLGLFDDLFSGQPIGSAAMLWSVVYIFIEIVDYRYLWRGFWQDWFIAAISIILVLAGGVAVNNIIAAAGSFTIILPQIILSIFLYPLVLRLVARLDTRRLA